MASKICAFLLGLVYLFLGICGTVPSLIWRPPDHLAYLQGSPSLYWGYIFGWMPSNVAHAILYMIIGALGVLAAATMATSTAYLRALLWLMVLFTFVGFLPFGIDQLWGYLPLNGWQIPFHTVTAVLTYYYGYIYPLDLGGGTEFVLR